jgi:hypothetical protein
MLLDRERKRRSAATPTPARNTAVASLSRIWAAERVLLYNTMIDEQHSPAIGSYVTSDDQRLCDNHENLRKHLGKLTYARTMFGWLNASISSTSLRTACSSKHSTMAAIAFGHNHAAAGLLGVWVNGM